MVILNFRKSSKFSDGSCYGVQEHANHPKRAYEKCVRRFMYELYE